MRSTAIRRHRLAVLATAIIATIFVLLCGGSLAAFAAPTSVTIGTVGGGTLATGGTISGTVAWNGSDGTIEVRVRDEGGTVRTYCPGMVSLEAETTWACAADLELGTNEVYAVAVADDDLGNELISGSIFFTRGTAAQVLNDPVAARISGASTTITGTGPVGGTVSIEGYLTATGGPAVPLCPAVNVAVAGTWSCVTTVPTLGAYTLQAVGTLATAAAATPSASFTSSFDPAEPGLSISSIPTALGSSATVAPSGDTVGSYWTYIADQFSAATPAVYCPAGWDYATPPATPGPVDCALGTPLAGSYLVTSNSFINGAYSTDRTDLIRIPNAPTLDSTVAEANGTVTASGTVDSTWSSPYGTTDGGTEVTVTTASGQEICRTVPDGAGDYSCNGAAPSGTHVIRVSATSVNFAGSPATFDGYHDGTSAWSGVLEETVIAGGHVQFDALPSLEWAPGPFATISGTSPLDAPVSVSIDGVPSAACSTLTPDASNAWSCTPALSPGSYTLEATQTGSLPATGSFIVSLPPLGLDSADPLAVPLNGTASFFGTLAWQNGTVTITLTGHSSSCTDSVFVAGAWGCSLDLTGLPAGTYQAILKQTFSDAPPSTRHVAVTVGTLATTVSDSTPTTPTPTPTPTPMPPSDDGLDPSDEIVPPATTVDDSGSAAGAPANPRNSPGASSALSGGLAPPFEKFSNPLAVVAAGSIGLALLLLVLVPAEFFGEALASQYSAFGGFLSRRRRARELLSRISQWIDNHRAIAGTVLVAVTSLVFSFVDPGFGFDLTSLRLLLSCAVSIVVINFVSAAVTEKVAERAWKVPTRYAIMPWGLAMAIIGVLISRALDFSPGFLIGSIIGVGVVAEVAARLEARVIVLWSSIVWGLSMVAWLSIGAVPVLAADDPVAFWTALLSDSLVATASAGLTALVVALLPIALFDGGALFAYSKLRWAIAFGIAVASFALVVVPDSENWMSLDAGIGPWLVATVIFIGLALGAYLWSVRRSRTRQAQQPESSLSREN